MPFIESSKYDGVIKMLHVCEELQELQQYLHRPHYFEEARWAIGSWCRVEEGSTKNRIRISAISAVTKIQSLSYLTWIWSTFHWFGKRAQLSILIDLVCVCDDCLQEKQQDTISVHTVYLTAIIQHTIQHGNNRHRIKCSMWFGLSLIYWKGET